MLRPDAREQRLPRRGARARRALRADLRRLRRRRLAVVVVRRHGARSTRSRDRAARVRAVGAARAPARRRGRRRVVPAPRHLPPDVPLAARDAGSATRRCGCCGTCAGSSSSSSTRADECCGFGGTFAVKNADTSSAMLADKCDAIEATGAEVCTAVDSSCLLQIGGGLARGAARRPRAAPRRDPRVDGDHVSIDAFPEAAARELANAAAAREPARRDGHDPRKRARVVAELPDWEELREAGRAIKADVLARLDEYLAAVRGGGRRRPAVTCTGRATRAEANAIVAEIARAHGVDEVVKVKSLTTDEIELNDALAAAGIHALETDFAELILQLDGDWSSHILVPAIHRNRARDPRPLRAHDRARHHVGRPARPRRGGAASTCASGSCARRSASAARTSASPRPARSASSSRRATGACARRCRRCSSRCSGSRSSCRASPTSRCSCSCCRARRPASG